MIFLQIAPRTMISPFLQKSVFEGRPLAGAGCLIEFGSGPLHHRVRARKSSRETRVERRGLGFFDWLATCFNLSMLFPRLSFGLRLTVLAPGLLTFAFSLQVRAADVVWVGDDNVSNGAWSRTGNWTNNTAPNFQTNNRIVFQNNLTSTNMLYDLSGWVNASDIIWDTTFNVSRTLNSTAEGIDFATRVENLSSNTQTVAMNLSGGKFGATGIELNPVNGDLVINGPFFNDNSLSYNIWGNTGRTLTLNSTLGPNATNQSGVAFTIQRNTTVVLNTNQLWQGTTTLNGGNLRMGASGLLGNGAYSGAIVMNSINGTNASLFFSNSANQTLSGAISGTGSFTMAGTGTVTLSGTNTHTGPTTISGGTLALNGDSRGATGSVTVSSGGTLAGRGTVGGATTIQSGAMHAPGSSPGLQTFNNGLTYNTGSTFQWELIGNTVDGRNTNYDAVNVTGGTLSIGTGVTSSLVFNTSSSTVSWNDVFWNENRNWLVFDNANSPTLDSTSVFDTINLSADSLGKTLTSDRPNAFFGWNRQGSDVYLTYTAVPEPSTYALLALATAALGAHAWRRRRRAMGR